MSTVATQQPVVEHGDPVERKQVTVYSHSSLFYWWPVWVIGYLLAAVTYFQGKIFTFADAEVMIHPSKNLGVIFTVVTLLVLMMTHSSVRGAASLTVVIAILAVTFLFAYLGWWDNIFSAVAHLAMFMNLGFYIFFSTGLLIIWALAFLIFDRMTYFQFRPGQMVHYSVLGGAQQTYDTHGLSVNNLRDDLFRHWVLGLGSGDLHIVATGAVRGDFDVPNVLFINRKLRRIQQLVAMKPDETNADVVTAGEPD